MAFLNKTLREIFSSFGQVFIPTSWLIFNKLQFDLTKMVNTKVVEGVSRFPKHPREWIYHIWAKIFKGLKLGIHCWIASHFCWKTHNPIGMICCIILCYRAPFLKISSWFNAYTLSWAITQVFKPLSKRSFHLWHKGTIATLEKQAFWYKICLKPIPCLLLIILHHKSWEVAPL